MRCKQYTKNHDTSHFCAIPKNKIEELFPWQIISVFQYKYTIIVFREAENTFSFLPIAAEYSFKNQINT